VPGQNPPEVSSTLWEGESRTLKPALQNFSSRTPAQDSRDQFPSTGYLQARWGNNPSLAVGRIRWPYRSFHIAHSNSTVQAGFEIQPGI